MSDECASEGFKTETQFHDAIGEIPGDNILEYWLQDKKLLQAKGKFPVILGRDADWKALCDSASTVDETPAELVGWALELDAEEIFLERYDCDPEYYDLDDGHWPSQAQPHSSIVTAMDLLCQEPLGKVLYTKANCAKSWQLPAYLKFGGWNDCPFPQEHAAVMKYWQEKYGAEIVSMTCTVMECHVERPPQTQEEAMVLARQQYYYCPDIVEQGVEDLSSLAASLLKAPLWFFWWD